MVRSVAYMAAVGLGVIRAKRMVTSSYRSMRKLMTIHKARVYAKSIVMLRDSDGFTTAIYYLDRYYPLEVTGSHCMPSGTLLSKTTQSLWHLMGNWTCGPVLDSNHHKSCTYSVIVVTEDRVLDKQDDINTKLLDNSHLPPEVVSEIYERDEILNKTVRRIGGKLGYMSILSLSAASKVEKNLDYIRAEYSRIEERARWMRKGRWH